MLVAVASCFGIKAYAQENDTDPSDMPGASGPISFISAIAVDTKSLATDNLHYIPDNHFTLIDKDLNKGRTGSDYVYIGFKTTNDPTEAITDIIVVNNFDGSEYRGDNHKTIVWNGKTYYPAEYGSDSKGGNLNRGASGIDNVYLYYTKDRHSAGITLEDKPLRSISVEEGLYYIGGTQPPGYYEQFAVGLKYLNNTFSAVPDPGNMGAEKFYFLKLDRHTHTKSSEPNPDGFHTCTVCKAVLDMNTDVPQLDEGGFYGIRNAAQLHWFINYVNSDPAHSNASARLYENIDLATSQASGMKFDPIGSGEKYFKDGAPVNYWAGTFDGNGRSISNLQQDGTTSKNMPTNVLGFIGAAKDCKVTNLKLKDADLSCTQGQGDGSYVAGIIGYATGTKIVVEDCEVNGTIKASVQDSNQESYAAGILNFNDESGIVTVKGCINNASITSKNYVAGILARSYTHITVKIDECENNGNVTSNENKAYAISNATFSGHVKNCLNTGNVRSFDSREDISSENHIGEFCAFAYGSCTNNLIISGCKYYMDLPRKLLGYKNYELGDTDENHLSAGDCNNGKACFLLNNETNQDVIWTQHLGEEDYPHPHNREYVVSRYTWHDNGFYEEDRFTNYKMFADDANTVHRWEESNVTCNSDMTTATATLTCKLCNKKINVTANRTGKTVFKEALCDREGLEEYAFQTNAEGEAFKFYVTKEITNYLTKSHGNYIFNAELGVKVCDRCGHVANEGFEEPERIDDVICISKPGHLMWLNEHLGAHRGEHVKLMNDLDISYLMSHKDESCSFIYNFKKTVFDGNEHTISGYNNYTPERYSSFFGLTDESVIKNLTIEGNVHGEEGNVAMMCYSLENSRMDNCIVRGKVSAGKYVRGTCSAGLVGEVSGSVVYGCRNYADVLGTSGYVGGIAFECKRNDDNEPPLTISKCANYGNISGLYNIGGIVSFCDPTSGTIRISDCANYGNIDGNYNVGGITGRLENDRYRLLTTIEVFYGINVGKITLHKESNAKGGLCGIINYAIDSNSLEAKQFYYTNVPVAVGTIENGRLVTNNVKWETEKEIASDATCAALNYVDNDYFYAIDPDYDNATNDGESDDEDDSEEREFINQNKAVWALENVNGKLFPSPFGTLKREIVHLNGEKLYVIQDEVLDKLEILDGFYFNSPTTFSVKDLYYNRNEVKVKKDFYATINLPFAFRDERLKIFAYDHYDNQTGRIYLREVEETEPETPYLVRLADNSTADEAELLIKAENAGIAKSIQQFPKLNSQIPYMETGFYGTYAKQRVVNGADGFYCFSTKYGDFRKANITTGTKVGPFRAVFKIKHDSAADTFTQLPLYEGEDYNIETYIDPTLFIEGDAKAPIYNLNGQRIANSDKRLPDGIYIKGSKKIIVK